MNLAKALAEGFRRRMEGMLIYCEWHDERDAAFYKGWNHADRLIKEVENRT